MDYTNRIESSISRVVRSLSPQQFYCFYATLIAGLVAHGYVLFNRISYHDNSACLFNLGGTYESGRWMLGFIYDLQMKTTKLFSVPVFNGGLSIIFVAIAAMLLVKMFDIESKFLAASIGAIMVVYPVVTSIFSFMFTSWEYHLALLLSVTAAKALTENLNLKGFVLATLFATMSLGLYQAFLAVTVVLFLIKLFMGVLDDKFQSPIDYIKTGIIYLANLGLSLVLWALMRKLTMAIKGITAVDYKGMDEGYSLAKFPTVLVGSLKAFFGFGQAGINAVLYQKAFTAVIVIVTILQIAILLKNSKSQLSIKLVSLLGLVLIPIGMNMVYLLSTSSEYKVDSLMVYGDIFVYLFPILLIARLERLQQCESTGGNETIKETGASKSANTDSSSTKMSPLAAVTWLQIACLAIMTFGYIYMDNAAYMKAEIAEEQASAYFNQLVTAIKTCDGFEEDMDVIFVGWADLDDGTFVEVDNNSQLDAVKLEKYPRYTDIVSYGGSIHFIKEHIGFGNEHLIDDDGTVAKEAKVKAMPTYPNDGSIAVVDGRVIVKLGEPSEE
ncbi:Glucosyl transferase GtrII [Pseudobutyrivibrio sp. YE44]|uniref:glucosyltransferase domain-containing protein n=1 Tax=Pseudobutyrivibrio sp. YE44 TaxID=1520802 RepID=UPI000882987D|nr:glucosyltransferase domain-containing protein [Pseudobutyrivibrio sp. YE44]SDB56173.1 Glucosyl transferase GtrII [Pseudobutyrivibrio sp. YE44]